MTKVFISYSHDSPQHADRVLALADRLTEQGLECTVDRDIESPAEGWPLWMERQTETADYILVVCTKTYKRRAKREEPPDVGRGVKWESVFIYQDLYDADSLNTKFIPVLFDSADEHHIPRPLRGATHYRVDTDEGYEKLYRRLTKQPARVKPIPGKVVAMPPDNLRQSPTAVWNVPYERNVFFTGREKELEELRQALAQNSAAALSQTQAISGLGGIGKTQMAVEYAYRHRQEYRAVLWVRAESEQSIITGYAEAARLMELPEKEAKDIEETVRAVKRWLEREEGWLLIFDNADKPALLKPYKPVGTKGQILITSRARNFSFIGVKNAIELRVMLPQEAIDFLLNRISSNNANKAEIEAAAHLAKELGYLPLALEQAGAYIFEKQASIQGYLISYKKRRLELLNKANPEAGDYPESVATTWSLNFEEVERGSKAAIELLRVSAFLSPDSIPFELVKEGASELGEELSLALAHVNDEPILLNDVLGPLIKYSLIRIDEENQIYSIHRMIQEVIKSHLLQGELREYSKRVVLGVNSVFPSGTYDTWIECERLLEQGNTGVGLIDKWGIESEEAVRLIMALATFYKERGDFEESELLVTQTLRICRKLSGKERLDVAVSLNNLALVCKNQGRYKEAERLYLEALQSLEKVLGEDHPDVALSLNNLGRLYHSQGRYEEAEPLFNRSLQIRQRVFGTEHRNVATSLNSLASLYYKQGRNTEAELLYKRALSIREKVLGQAHPSVATILNNLAGPYKSQGRYAEAEQLGIRALKIWENAYGERHPNFAVGLNTYAELLRMMQRDTEAEEIEARAEAIHERLSQRNPPA